MATPKGARPDAATVVSDDVPQLSVEMDNQGARNTIYVTADPTVNKLVLKITTNTTAQLTPGIPVPKKQASSGTGSLLYLDLSPLKLSAAEIDGLGFRADNWQFKSYGIDGVVCMTPTAEQSIEPGPGNEIEIPIAGLTLATAPGPNVSTALTYYRVQGVTRGNLAMVSSFTVLFQQAPDGGGDLTRQIGLAVLQPYVVNTIPPYDPVLNSLSILFHAQGGGLQVPAGPHTQFTLAFVFASAGPGFGALCTPAQALASRLGQGTNARWDIARGVDQQNPSWQLKPPAGRPIVGTGSQATVEFILTDLITNFEPGPTEMYVSWSGIPGYKDGSWAVPLIKSAHVVINDVTVTPNPSVLTDGVADVTISWDVRNAGTLTLSPVGGDVTGKTSVKATLTDTTPITLAADGRQLASLGNRALYNAQAVVRPVINSFTAAPVSVYARDLPRSVALSWNVNTNGNVMLRSTVGAQDPNSYAHIGGVSKPILGPQMFTLVPVGSSPDDPAARRSIVVSAFTTQLSEKAIAGGVRSVAVPPSASYVVVAGPGGNTLTALDTVLYEPLGGPIPVGSDPAGMAFSPDGRTLYVANSGDGTLSAIAVTPKQSVPQYTFAALATVRLGGSPQQVAVSPDGAYVYVTVDNGTVPGSLEVLAAGPDGPARLSGVPVGLRPRGVTVMPTGLQVYVANSGSDSVTVVGMKPGWKKSALSTLTGFTSRPVSVEMSADCNVLLVACAGSNTVYAVNAVYPNTAPRNQLTVGNSPSQVVRIPGGEYALVTNQDDGSVTLIGVGPSPSACTVLDTVATGSRPSGLAVSAEAGLAIAGTPAGLSVLTLAQYVQQEQNLPDIGDLPTDVTIAPHGEVAVAWHDATNTLGAGQPSTGLFVYDLKSGVVTRQLSGQKIVGFTYHPSAAAATGYAVMPGQPTVSVLDTQTWQATGQIGLAAHTQGTVRRLAVAGDGGTLFVLTRDAQFSYDLVIFGIDIAKGRYTALTTLRIGTTSPGSAAHLVTAPDGTRAYMIDGVTGKLWVIARDTGGWAVAGSPLAIGTLPDALTISPDGSRLFAAGRGQVNYSLIAIETATLAVRQTVLAPSSRMQLNGLAVAPDGTRLFATDQIMSGVRVFDTASLRLIQTISWSSGVQGPWGLAITPDASQLFTANMFSGNLGVVQQVQGAPSHPTALLDGELDAERFSALAADPSHQGLLIRRSLQNMPWTDCPDIWPAGTGPLPDPGILVTDYGENSPNGITNVAQNFIYVRGQNTTSATLTARVWLYWVNASGNPDLILWPDNWGESGLNTAYIEVTATTPNQIVYTNPPFTLDGKVLGGTHYCLVTIVENPPLSTPAQNPRPTTYMGDITQLAAYFAAHPNMGWKNTTWQSVTQPTWQRTAEVRGPNAGGLFYVGIRCLKMPTDGSYALYMPGPDPDGTISTPILPITTQNMLCMQPVSWPEKYHSTLTITYYRGDTAPTPGQSSIGMISGSETTELIGLVADPLSNAIRGRIYPRLGVEHGVRTEWLTLVGSVTGQFTP